MTLKDQLLAQLHAEAPRTRRTVERVPEGRADWKPHDKSMPLGRLAMLVSGMPAWISMIIERDDLDLNPPGGGSNYQAPSWKTGADLAKIVDENVEKAKRALEATTDEHLMKPWRLLVSGRVVSEDVRHVVLRDTFMHLAHHRGQLTVYLRMNEAPVPAIYGPSADDQSFA